MITWKEEKSHEFPPLDKELQGTNDCKGRRISPSRKEHPNYYLIQSGSGTLHSQTKIEESAGCIFMFVHLYVTVTVKEKEAVNLRWGV